MNELNNAGELKGASDLEIESNIGVNSQVDLDMNEDEEGVKFFTFFKNFACQAVVGTVKIYWKEVSNNGKYDRLSREEVIKKFIDRKEIRYNLIRYFNNCWKYYSEKSDKYVVSVFMMIILYGKFKHESCAFGFVWDFLDKMLLLTLKNSQVLNFTNEALMKQSLEYVCDMALEEHKSDISTKYWGCISDEKCGTVYKYKKGEEFLYFE